MTVARPISREEQQTFARCRIQHWWEDTDDHGYIYRGSKDFDTIVYNACVHCNTFKAEMVKFDGRYADVVARYYKYPDGYSYTTDETGGDLPTRGYFRYLMLSAMEGKLGEPDKPTRHKAQAKKAA